MQPVHFLMWVPSFQSGNNCEPMLDAADVFSLASILALQVQSRNLGLCMAHSRSSMPADVSGFDIEPPCNFMIALLFLFHSGTTVLSSRPCNVVAVVGLFEDGDRCPVRRGGAAQFRRASMSRQGASGRDSIRLISIEGRLRESLECDTELSSHHARLLDAAPACVL